jgi:hypothetical protein
LTGPFDFTTSANDSRAPPTKSAKPHPSLGRRPSNPKPPSHPSSPPETTHQQEKTQTWIPGKPSPCTIHQPLCSNPALRKQDEPSHNTPTGEDPDVVSRKTITLHNSSTTLFQPHPPCLCGNKMNPLQPPTAKTANSNKRLSLLQPFRTIQAFESSWKDHGWDHIYSQNPIILTNL